MNLSESFLDTTFVSLLALMEPIIIAIFVVAWCVIKGISEARHRASVETHLQALNAKTETVVELLRSQQKRDA